MDIAYLPIKLLITDIGYALSIIIIFGSGIFVFTKAPHKEVNRIFFLYSIAVLIFLLSHIVGVNLHDPELSRIAFMGNLATIFISVLTAHWILAVVGRLEAQRATLKSLYIIAFSLVIFFIAYPSTFLLPSAPKLYFANYYVVGTNYFLGDIFFYSVFIYFFYHVVSAYAHADLILRNRLKYIVSGFLAGYALSILPALLIYNIDVDPILSCLVGLYFIPITYSLIKQELLDIHVVAKRALFYSLAVVAAGIIIVSVNYLNIFLIESIPEFPSWIVPLLSAFIAVEIGRLIWQRLKQLDILKYEFINVVTHKFRTPLTYIKWSIETLKRGDANETTKAISDIETAGTRLNELTEILIETAATEKDSGEYILERIDLSALLQKVESEQKLRMTDKQLHFTSSLSDRAYVAGDRKKIEYVLQVVLENAILYTKKDGVITATIKEDQSSVSCTIADTGIGISKDDIPHIFDKFFRSRIATLADTEGMGLRLYIAKTIIDRHGGTIVATSTGIGKGATFTISLPRAKV